MPSKALDVHVGSLRLQPDGIRALPQSRASAAALWFLPPQNTCPIALIGTTTGAPVPESKSPIPDPAEGSSPFFLPHQSWIYLLKGLRKDKGVELLGLDDCSSLPSLVHLCAHYCELPFPHSHHLNFNHLLWLSSGVTSAGNIVFSPFY